MRGGIFIGLVAGTLVAVVIEAIWHLGSAVERPGGWSLSVPALSGSPFAMPDLSLVGAFSLDSFGRIGVLAAVMLVFTLVFANFFDAMGTFTGLSREAGVADERGTFPRLRSALIVEGAGAVVGGATSSSSNTVFLESAAGIEEGARTGLANLVTGVLFFAAMFVTPLASIVPTEVAAAALVIVGVMMFSHLRDIDLSEFSVALPVVLTVAVMPLQFLDRQRNRHRLHRMGRRALGSREGARDQSSALDRRRRLPGLLRARLDRITDRHVIAVPDELLTHRGGRGEPLVLVHGLMGRGSTWSRQLPWLTRHGEVYTYDAPWHRGRDVADPYPISTERFVDDLGDAVAALDGPRL